MQHTSIVARTVIPRASDFMLFFCFCQRVTSEARVVYSTRMDVSAPLSELIAHSSQNSDASVRSVGRRLSRRDEAPLLSNAPDFPGTSPDGTSAPVTADLPITLVGPGLPACGVGGCSLPADPSGAAGDSHYVHMVNVKVGIFNKTTGAAMAVFASGSLWSGFGGPCQLTNDGDGIVRYDRVRQNTS